MLIKPHEVHLYKLNLDKLKGDVATLTEAERTYLETLLIARANTYLVTRSALRRILSQYLDIAPNKIPFSFTAHQKPYIASEALQFNLSHSGNKAVIAINLNNSIGIDIEKNKLVNFSKIVNRYFSQQEKNWWASLKEKEQESAFFKLWTKKEALTKALGKGISYGFHRFTVSGTENKELISIEQTDFNLISLSLYEDYFSALASHPLTKEIVLFDYED